MRTALGLVLLSLLPACSTVPETGRSQLALLPESLMTEMGASAYQDVTAQHREITSGAQYQMVREVGQRIAKASGRNFAWEFKLLDEPETVNAFCLPGGKIAVYTGMLKVAPDADSLAAVVGHEVAHATAHHGNERMTQKMGLSLAIAAADALIGRTELDSETKQLAMAALGVGASVGVILPYSRAHESEADEIGLRFAIRAGYDPHAAPKLWERMAQLGENGPEFLSTHPDPLKRAERLRELIPKLLAEERPR